MRVLVLCRSNALRCSVDTTRTDFETSTGMTR